MRHLPHPRSRGFRAMLGMALLAWAMLASGALAGSLRGGPFGMTDAVQMATTHANIAHCDDMSMQQSDAQRSPAMPVGHGCCQVGCHCLSTCSVMLSVPLPGVVENMLRQLTLPVTTPAAFAQTPAALPLRPPIV